MHCPAVRSFLVLFLFNQVPHLISTNSFPVYQPAKLKNMVVLCLIFSTSDFIGAAVLLSKQVWDLSVSAHF